MSTTLKRIPLLFPALGWVSGLALARLDDISLQFCLLLLVFFLFLLLKWRIPAFYALIFGLSYGLLTLVLDVQRVQVSPQWLDHKINITALVEDVRQSKQYTRLRLKQVTQTDEKPLSGLVDVYVYRNKQTMKAGMLIQAKVKLHVPRNKLNPAAFDYESYAFEQHIALIGSVSGAVKILSQEIPWLELWRDKIRMSLRGLKDESQGVLLALLLADRSKIPLNIDDAFAASGATHLLAISGLHMGLVAGWGFMLSWWLITRRETWIVKLPVRSVSLSVGLLMAMAYATLAGWPIPAQRASLMLLAGVVAWWFRASQVPLNTMLAALMLIVLFDPASVLSISIWLSFVATSSLIIWVSSQGNVDHWAGRVGLWFKGMFWVSIIASLATLPLIGFIFERLPVWSLIANAVLVPMYAFWILPWALLGELLVILDFKVMAELTFNLSAWVIDWANAALLYIQNLPAGNLWLRGDLPWVYFILFISLIVAGVCLLKKSHKKAFLVLVVTLFCYANLMLGETKVETTEFHVWDVGQGASALVRLPNFNLVIDAPGKQGSKYNGGTIAAQNARALGLLHLDAVVLSHAQSDHAGGITRLLTAMNGVGELWLADVPMNRHYPAIKNAAQHINVRWLKQGDVIKLEDGRVDVLWPPLAYKPSNGNNASLVLLLTLTSGKTILLPGDMEKYVEQRILLDLEPVDVLLMPHHGSKTSSTVSFVNATQPKIVIVQTGYRNHYGFPKKEVMQRYQDVRSQVWNTAQGAISIVFEDNIIKVTQFSDKSASKRRKIALLF